MYTGSAELVYGQHSRYKCTHCQVTYEYLVHAEPGEYEKASDPVPPHFELLSEIIDADHDSGHKSPVFQSNGRSVWNPMGKPAELAWTN